VPVFDRNSVHDTYSRPKFALAGLSSTPIQFLSLKSTDDVFVVAITGSLHVGLAEAKSSEYVTMMYSKPLAASSAPSIA
jgi:hypothetical protein